jgi:hypothetical protein
MASQLHSDRARAPGPLQVPDRRPPEIVNDAARDLGRLTGLAPALVEIADGPSIAMKHKRDGGLEFLLECVGAPALGIDHFRARHVRRGPSACSIAATRSNTRDGRSRALLLCGGTYRALSAAAFADGNHCDRDPVRPERGGGPHSYTESVMWPVIDFATFLGVPAFSRFLCGMVFERWVTPQDAELDLLGAASLN